MCESDVDIVVFNVGKCGGEARTKDDQLLALEYIKKKLKAHPNVDDVQFISHAKVKLHVIPYS